MKIIKNSFIYTIVSIFQKALAFFLLPLYTSFLNKAEYGIVSLVTSITNLLSIFFILGLNGALGRFYFDNKTNEAYIKELFGTISIFVFIVSLLLGILLVIFHEYIIDPFVKDISFYPYIFIGILSIIFSPLYLLYQTALQTKQLAGRYGLNNLLYFLCNIGFTIILVVPFRLNALGILLAIAATNMIFFITSFISFLPMIKLTIDKRILSESIKYSLPLVPHSLSSWAVTMLDRIFINNFKNSDSVGLYSIGYQFSNILNIITSGINQAFSPWLFDKLHEKKTEEINKIVQFAEYMIVFYCMISLVLTFFGKEILSLMVTKSFHDGWIVIPYLSFGYVFGGLYYFFANVVVFNKNGTKWFPIATISGAIISSILNIILIPSLDIVGAAISNLLSNIVISVIVFIMMKKIEPIPYKWKKMYAIIFFSFAISMIIHLEAFLEWGELFIIKICLTAIITSVIFLHYKKEMQILINLLIKNHKSH